jgi:hypothetical protein
MQCKIFQHFTFLNTFLISFFFLEIIINGYQLNLFNTKNFKANLRGQLTSNKKIKPLITQKKITYQQGTKKSLLDYNPASRYVQFIHHHHNMPETHAISQGRPYVRF